MNKPTLSGSDHKAVTVTIRTTNFIRGPGIWRFNNSLLKDLDYIEMINTLIEKFKTDQSIKDPILKWELLKAEVKSFTKQFCTFKKTHFIL